MWNLGRIFSQGEVIWNYPACSDPMSVTACGAMSSLSLCSSLPTLCLQATLRGRLSFWINGPTCTPTCPQARHTEEDEMKNSSQVADDLLLDEKAPLNGLNYRHEIEAHQPGRGFVWRDTPGKMAVTPFYRFVHCGDKHRSYSYLWTESKRYYCCEKRSRRFQLRHSLSSD